MSAENKVPAIRFKGFSGEWVDSALLNLVVRVSAISDKALLPRVEYEDIISGKGILNKNIYEKESAKTGIYFDSGDILFGKLRPYLRNWLLPSFEGIAVGDFWILRANESNNKFIYYLIQTAKFETVANQSAGSKMPRSDWGLVSTALFGNPKNIKEQTKIGNYFQQLDTLIAQHQQKHDKLLNLKKALLEKMFPKQGEKVPEIRFKGFGGEWEEKVLGAVYNFQYGQFNINPSDGGKYPVFGANGIIGGYSNFNAENSVVIGHMGEYAGSVLWGEGKHFVTYNGTIAKPKSVDTNPIYGYYILYKLNIKKICGGSGQPFLSYDTLQKLIGAFPESTTEQTKIGNFFKQLDTLINQHQAQLKKLNNIKQACLEKMFV